MVAGDIHRDTVGSVVMKIHYGFYVLQLFLVSTYCSTDYCKFDVLVAHLEEHSKLFTSV